MPSKQTETACVVHLVRLYRLPDATRQQCQTLRQEKAARTGITVERIYEAYSTKTCSFCMYVHSNSPRGRRFRFAGCGARPHRDVNGSNNICSKGAYGVYGQV